ncbi:MAG: hypothetical protein WCK39_05230 [Methanomassiliicoccales archaeon]
MAEHRDDADVFFEDRNIFDPQYAISAGKDEVGSERPLESRLGGLGKPSSDGISTEDDQRSGWMRSSVTDERP